MARMSARTFSSITFLLLVAQCAAAQRPSAPTIPTAPVSGMGVSRGAKLVVRVMGADGTPLALQAVVKLSSATSSQQVYAGTQGLGQVIFDRLAPGSYIIEVTAPGYSNARQETEIVASGMTHDVDIKMFADTGESAVPEGPPILAPKARKEVEKGMAALKAGNYAEARSCFEAAYKLAPGNPDVNFLLGLLFLQMRNLNQAQSYLERTTSLDPRHVSGLTALGEVKLRQGDSVGAADPLERAVQIDHSLWLAHSLLSGAYLGQGQFEKARAEAELAMRWGKGAAISAEFVLGESLAALGRREEAIQALQKFQQDAPSHPAAVQARQLAEKLKVSQQAAEDFRRLTAALSAGPSSFIGITDARLSLPSWAPPGVDQERPSVDETAPCSLSQVLGGATARVNEFVASVDRFTATEDLVHQNLDEFGNTRSTENRTFNYMVSISEIRPGVLNVDEYRNGSVDPAQFPEHLSSTGLAVQMLVFHPVLRDDFQMTCEGLGDWHGQPAWQVYFRQRPDRPSRIRDFRLGGALFPVSLKGRAWIAADSYEILRIETDLVRPMPEIRLLSEHIAIDYGPVDFPKRNTRLWLPTAADLYSDFRGHRFHRRHSYRDYLLFSVDEKQKISPPKADGQKNPGSIN